MNWFYESGGQQQGPVSDGDLDQLIAQGKVTPATLVWREGMANWQPLSQARSVGAPPIPAGSSEIPGIGSGAQSDLAKCDACGRMVGRAELVQIGARSICAECKPRVLQQIQQGSEIITSDGDRTGPPWEQREQLGIPPAIIETVKKALLEPSETFSRMRRTGGLGGPLTYYLITAGVGSVALTIYLLIFQTVMGTAMGANPIFGGRAAAAAGMSVFMIIFQVLWTVFWTCIFSFVQAAILHGCLMLCGGAKQPFETTYRVVCYGAGSVGILHVIPGIGSIVAIPLGIIVPAIGLARSHETDTWRGVLAIFLPMIVCCGLFAALAMVIGIASSHH